MKLAMYSVLLIALMVHCGCASTELASQRAGAVDAGKEIQAGKLALEEYGFGAGPSTPYRKYLESLGIEFRTVAGCVVHGTIVGHAAGFNEAMTREIKARFGPDVFERALEKNQQADQGDPVKGCGS